YIKQIRGFMQAVGLKRTSLIGLSMGGWIASAFAIRHPELVEKLVLISSSGMLVDEANSARIQSSRAGAVSDPTWEKIQGVFANLIHDESKRMDDLVALRLNIYRRADMKAAMQHIIALQGSEIRDRNLIPEDDWKKISAPT